MSSRLDHLTNLVKGFSLRTVQGRLVHFLLEHTLVELGKVTEAGQVAQPAKANPVENLGDAKEQDLAALNPESTALV